MFPPPHLQYMMLLRLRVSMLTTSAATSRELSNIWRAEEGVEREGERVGEGQREWEGWERGGGMAQA